MKVDLSIHSFSLWHHFKHVPGFGAVAFAELCRELGFTGVNLSLNDPQFRHLGGTEAWRIREFRQWIDRSGMRLEVDTSNTAPQHMARMIAVAAELGAGSLRTYTRHGGTPAEMMAATAADLAAVMGVAEEHGVTVVLENHEDFTGPEVAAIMHSVNHPRLRVLYDYGNSQMVLEDPEAALEAVLPFVASVHVKDHVMVRAEHAGRLTVAGVPMGEGFLPVRRITARLLEAGLRRLCFENVWAYAAPIRAGRSPLDGVVLGEGSFRYLDPPFDPARVVLDQTALSGLELVRLERAALDRGLAWFRAELAALSVEIAQWSTPVGVDKSR